ncbi:hypothetical protein OAT10_04280 [Luminiphilus sp.]|nr:hypothetical protein [Luminiphilus sp.]
MAIYADNTMGSFQTFEGRKKFREQAYDRDQAIDNDDLPIAPEDRESHLIDILYDNPYYGKVDASFDIITPRVENLASVESASSNIYAMSFVARAFEHLRTHMMQAQRLRKINLRNSPFGRFEVVKGQLDHFMIYGNHLNGYIGKFATEYIFINNLQDKIFTFKDFLRYFNKYLFDSLAQHPITYSGFLRSRFCSSAISGLILEVGRGEESRDGPKIQWINNSNYSFYVNAAKKYGFYVDKNCPWRLIADISSVKMQEYFNYTMDPMSSIEDDRGEQGFSISSVRRFFEIYYIKAFNDDIFFLKDSLFTAYNNFVQEYPTAYRYSLVGCANPGFSIMSERQNYTAVVHKIERSFIRREAYDEKYSDLAWLLYYFDIRLAESRINWSNAKKTSYKKRIILMYNRLKTKKDSDEYIAYAAALDYINDQVMKYSDMSHKRLTKLKERNVISSY